MTMKTRYRVIGRSLGIYDVPNECVELVEDIHAIELAVQQVRTVNHWNITTGGDELGRQCKWVTIRALELWLSVARKKLQHEFLAPDRTTIRKRTR